MTRRTDVDDDHAQRKTTSVVKPQRYGRPVKPSLRESERQSRKKKKPNTFDIRDDTNKRREDLDAENNAEEQNRDDRRDSGDGG